MRVAGAFIFALIGVALVLELAARVAESVAGDVRASRATRPDWFEYAEEVGWRARPGYAGEVYGARRAFDARGFLAVDADDLDVRGPGKIVFLGDSRTFGNGVAAEATFAEQLEEAIPGAATVNLAVPGYTSYQGRRVLEARGLALEPAVLVVAFDFNDRRYVLREADVDGPGHLRDVAQRAERAAGAKVADRLALVRIGRSLLGRRTRPDPMASGPVPASALTPRVDLASYRTHLGAILAAARERGVATVVLLMADHPVAAAPLNRGELRVAIGLRNPLSELARRELRRVYEASGERALAEPLGVVAVPFRSLHGGDPIETDTAYRDAAREVAEAAGAAVVDAGAILAAHPETYTDICHFDEEGHRLIAEALATAILSARAAP